MQPIDLNSGGDTLISTKKLKWDIYGAGDTVLSGKCSPTQQIKAVHQIPKYPNTKMPNFFTCGKHDTCSRIQSIDLNGGGNPVVSAQSSLMHQIEPIH